MKLSTSGRNSLCDMEGIELECYRDSGGVPTIGVGHALTRSERRCGKIRLGSSEGNYREGLTLEQVHILLDQDLASVEGAVNRSVKVYLLQHQYDALVCWCFNIGVEAFKNSTLVRRLNSGNPDDVPAQFRRWVYDNGAVVAGLANRREKEIAIWLA